MSLESTIRKLASTLSIGNSGYFNCPKCARKNKFGITNTVEGLIYQCFSASCKLKGKLPNILNKDTISSILNRKAITSESTPFSCPEYLVDGFASENSLKMALRYDLLEGYSNKLYSTSYDPKLQRQVFFHKNLDGDIVGASGRALSIMTRPKVYIYPNTTKTPWVVGTGATAVIVEDILSAVKISNIGLVGVALSGTKLALEYLSWFKKYTTIIICLDKDASIQSLKLKKLLDIVSKDVKIVLIEKDFKDMTRDEARKVLAESFLRTHDNKET